MNIPKERLSELIATAVLQSMTACKKLNDVFNRLGIEISMEAYCNDDESYIKIVQVFKFKDKDLYDQTKKLLEGTR